MPPQRSDGPHRGPAELLEGSVVCVIVQVVFANFAPGDRWTQRRSLLCLCTNVVCCYDSTCI